MKKISETSSENSDKEFISLEKTRSAIISLFRGVKSEKFYFFLLNDAFQKVFCLEYSGNSDDSVFADTSEIARAMSVHKAKYAIMAHNHPSGNENPSETDDVATVKFYIVCDVYGINLVDHIIVTEKNTYGYFANERLSFIKEKADIEKLDPRDAKQNQTGSANAGSKNNKFNQFNQNTYDFDEIEKKLISN